MELSNLIAIQRFHIYFLTTYNLWTTTYTPSTHLSIEQAGKAHQENLKYASFKQCDLVVLWQKRKTGNALCEFHNTSDGWRESLWEIL